MCAREEGVIYVDCDEFVTLTNRSIHSTSYSYRTQMISIPSCGLRSHHDYSRLILKFIPSVLYVSL